MNHNANTPTRVDIVHNEAATMTSFHRRIIVAKAGCYDDDGALGKKHRHSGCDDAFFHPSAIVASSQQSRPPAAMPD